MKKVTELKWGPKALRKWAAEIEAAIRARQALPGIGIKVAQDPNGKGVSYNTAQR